MIDQLQPFAISFLIGFLIGIERERSHPIGTQAMGVRTFVLIALLGTIASTFDQIFLTIAISLFVFAAILLGYFRSTSKRQKVFDVGLTTEISAAVVFCLGYMTVLEPFVSAVIGAAVLLVLLGRKKLHKFSREKLTEKEIQAAVIVLIITIGILPFLPNKTIDPWQLFNPRYFGVLVLLIALIQFVGYVAMRVLGRKIGMMFLGFFGGLVSSTAVFASLPRYVKENVTLLRSSISAGLLAQIGTLFELVIVLFIISKLVAIKILLPILAVIIIGLILAISITFSKKQSKVIEVPKNPLDLISVIKLSTFIAVMIILVAIARRYFGEQGVNLIAFLGGLFELQSVSIATAILFKSGKLTLDATIFAIGISITSSFLTKFILLWTLARDKFAFYTSICLLLMLAAGMVVFNYT